MRVAKIFAVVALATVLHSTPGSSGSLPQREAALRPCLPGAAISLFSSSGAIALISSHGCGR
jgi:hypothetical protein